MISYLIYTTITVAASTNSCAGTLFENATNLEALDITYSALHLSKFTYLAAKMAEECLGLCVKVF